LNGDNGAKTILMVACQALPRPGRPAAGGGLRTWGLGQALEGRGHRVVYSVPRDCLEGDEASGPLAEFAHSVTDINEVAARAGAEAVLFANWGLTAEADDIPLPRVVDVNGSLILENYYRGHGSLLGDALAKMKGLARADLVICGSEAQKDYLTAWGLVSGLEPDKPPIEVVPFSLPPQMPEHRLPDEPVLIQAGYEWPWLRSGELLAAVGRMLDRLGRGRLEVFSGPPPYSDALPRESSAQDQVGSLQLEEAPRVIRREPVAYDELVGILSQSTAAVDLYAPNPERRLAFPSRTVVSLWCGLPVVTYNQGELAGLIGRYEAGWLIETAEGSDAGALERIIEEIVSDPDAVRRKSDNARRLVVERLTWERTVGPLDKFLRQAARTKKVSPVLEELEQQHRELVRLNEHHQRLVASHEKLIADHEALVQSQERLGAELKAIEAARERLASDNELLSQVHRRPKGFALFGSRQLFWRHSRRLLVGLPVWAYLFLLARTSYLLFGWWRRWGRV